MVATLSIKKKKKRYKKEYQFCLHYVGAPIIANVTKLCCVAQFPLTSNIIYRRVMHIAKNISRRVLFRRLKYSEVLLKFLAHKHFWGVQKDSSSFMCESWYGMIWWDCAYADMNNKITGVRSINFVGNIKFISLATVLRI